MKKRVLSLMLATVMCMALAVTANAVEYDSSMVNVALQTSCEKFSYNLQKRNGA